MKKIIITMVILASAMVQGIAQEKLKIGDVVNGKLSITNETGLRSFFSDVTGKSGTLDRTIKTDASPTSDRFLVYTKVAGNKSGVSCVGVLLVNIKNEAFIVQNPPDGPQTGPGIGGSATVSCIGNPCNSCYLTVEWTGNWLPLMICECNESGSCNMTITYTINLGVGY